MLRVSLAFIAACSAMVFVVGCNGSDSVEDRIIDRIRSLISDAHRDDLLDTVYMESLYHALDNHERACSRPSP